MSVEGFGKSLCTFCTLLCYLNDEITVKLTGFTSSKRNDSLRTTLFQVLGNFCLLFIPDVEMEFFVFCFFFSPLGISESLWTFHFIFFTLFKQNEIKPTGKC